MIKELTFEQEGEQGLRMDYFHVQTLDSILIFPSTGNEIVLTDTSGHVKNKIKVKSPEGYAGLFLHNSYYLSPPQISGNRLIGRVRGMVRPNEINQEQLNSMSLLMSVNLKDESISLLPFGFPEDYLENGQKQLEFSILKNGDQTVVSFMGDHKIYFKGSEEETWQSKICKSSFLDESMPTFPKDIDSRGYNTYALATSRYESLVFDPFRKVYYRFAYPTIQIESDEKLRSLRTNPGPFVIMVMDRDFNILTERKFDAGRYFPSNYFVGEKGLYLSTNHPENPEAKEDFLNFELLELIEE
ncbi:DUF4221 family protein [Algoriphagus halophilus]|uniref:DUF4221 family protein n=1 Tax=Algoriphagus halophilus TaxID=226505 RepID=UPI00358DEDE8